MYFLTIDVADLYIKTLKKYVLTELNHAELFVNHYSYSSNHPVSIKCNSKVYIR